MNTTPAKPKKFYTRVESRPAEGGFAIFLDDRPIKSRNGEMRLAPTQDLADAIRDEWTAQGEHVDMATMPITALLANAGDADPSQINQWREDIVAYLGSDLLCYRAEAPAELAARQQARWDPLLQWFDDQFGARLAVTAGIVSIEQPRLALDAVAKHLTALEALDVYALRKATGISGSAVLALALRSGAHDGDALFALSRIDEDFQVEKWGEDEEASARAQIMRDEFLLLERLFGLLKAA